MKIERFDTISRANYAYPNYKAKNGKEKVRKFDNKEYVKLGCAVIKHGLIWQASHFFKTAAMIICIPALFSANYRKSVKRSWKEFKSGEEIPLSIYVLKKLEIPNKIEAKQQKKEIAPEEKKEAATQSTLVTKPSWEEIRQHPKRITPYFEELLINRSFYSFEKKAAVDAEIKESFAKATLQELNQLVASENPLEWRNLINILALVERTSLPVEFRQKCLEHLRSTFESMIKEKRMFFPTKGQVEVINDLLPFHDILIEHLDFGIDIDPIIDLIFSYSITTIPDAFLQKCFKNNLRFLSEEPKKKVAQKIVQSCQKEDLNLLSPEALRSLVIFSGSCGTTIPEFGSLSPDKMAELVMMIKKKANSDEEIRILIHQLGSLQNEVQRDAQLANLFVNLEDGDVVHYLLDSKTEETDYLYLLYGCRDTQNPKCINGLNCLWEIELKRMHKDPIKLVKSFTAEQAVFFLEKDTDNLLEIGYWVSCTDQLPKFVEILNQAKLEKYLHQNFIDTLPEWRKKFIRELANQNKLFPILKNIAAYRIPSHLVEDLSIDEAKTCLAFFIQDDPPKNPIDLNTSSFSIRLTAFFKALTQNLESLAVRDLDPLNQLLQLESGKKLMACYDELAKSSPNLIVQAFHGIILALESEIHSYTLVSEKALDATLKLLEQIEARHPGCQKQLREYLTSYPETFFKTREIEEIKSLRRILVIRNSKALTEEEIDWLMKDLRWQSLSDIGLYFNLEQKRAMIHLLFDKHKIDPKGLIATAIFSWLRTKLTKNEFAQLNVDSEAYRNLL